ncbi:MAG TPA: hypothetical protein VF591_22340, partial [Pyrinomonadaceae bacterium]
VAPEAADTNSPPVQTADKANGGVKSRENSEASDDAAVASAKKQKPARPAGAGPNRRAARENTQVRPEGSRTRYQKQEGLSRELPREAARAVEPTWTYELTNAAAMYAAGSLRAADDPASRIGRHAERVERLLRSFRNARLTESDPTLGVADARRLSKRLLYNNIALRREAASAGDLPVEGLLDSVEPILIDISNLPNTPSPDAVGSIKERIHRRQLVGALQARGMLAPR